MMSDAAYAKNAQDKIRKYMQHGYYPMLKLITTKVQRHRRCLGRTGGAEV